MTLVALAMLAGCTASPWSSGSRTGAPTGAATPGGAAAQPPASQAATAAAKDVSPNVAAQASATAAPDPQAMQHLMAEVQQIGGIDPAVRDRLLEDLRQTDPALWPLLLQQFRAAIAFRQQAEAHKTAQSRTSSGAPRTADQSHAPVSPGQVSQQTASPGASVTTEATTTASQGPAKSQAAAAAPVTTATPVIAEKPATSTTERAQGGVPVAADKKTTASDAKAAAIPTTASAPGEAMAVSYTTTPLGDWQKHLAAAIRAKEAEVRSEAKTPDDEAQHAQLHLMYLAAGRREDALRAMPSASPATQAFWSEQLYGMATMLDTQRITDPMRRAGEAKQHLSTALGSLNERCPLSVRNIAFCTAIVSYGCTKPFPKNEFAPGQNVLLYAEVENLSAESTSQGHHTRLRSSYQIFDSRGQRVADNEFTLTEEYCQNPRRDYFIGYQLKLPEQIYPGKYSLQLTIEDVNSRKIGQSSIEFSIKKAER